MGIPMTTSLFSVVPGSSGFEELTFVMNVKSGAETVLILEGSRMIAKLIYSKEKDEKKN